MKTSQFWGHVDLRVFFPTQKRFCSPAERFPDEILCTSDTCLQGKYNCGIAELIIVLNCLLMAAQLLAVCSFIYLFLYSCCQKRQVLHVRVSGTVKVRSEVLISTGRKKGQYLSHLIRQKNCSRSRGRACASARRCI